LPGGRVRLRDGADDAEDACVVDHAVQPSEPVHRLLDEVRNLRLSGDVGVNEEGFAAEFGGELLAALVLQIGDHASRALFEKPAHRSLADAASAAGHHGNLAVEPTRHLLASVLPPADKALPTEPVGLLYNSRCITGRSRQSSGCAGVKMVHEGSIDITSRGPVEHF
jgi:hypothetical protein